MTVKKDKLRELVEKYAERIRVLRRTIHAHPETSNEEYQTAALLAAEMKELGLDVKTGIGGNGLIGTLHGRKPGRTVALRADMDALSISEATELPFASRHAGKMHACGHDGHMSILMGAAHVLNELRDTFDGDIIFVCQPAEENSPHGGAKSIVASGVHDGIDAIYGLHVWPTLPTGQIGVKAGPLMAASDRLTVTIRGKASHAAMPHKGIDAVVAACRFVSAAQDSISRKINPLAPAVLTFGKITGGTRYNIMADEVVIEGTCRTYDKETQAVIEGHLQNLIRGFDTIYGTESELAYEKGYGAVVNSAEQAAFAAAVAAERFGEEALPAITEPAMTAEDFSGYLEVYDGAFFWLGATAPGAVVYPLHNERFSLDEDCLPVGVEMLSALALAALKK